MRPGFNDPPITNAGPGWVDPQGMQATLQYKNKMVVVTSPYDLSTRTGVKSVQSTIALYNYQSPKLTWEIYVDGQRVTQLPFTAKQEQRITIKDGVTYLGIIPLKATDLGRKTEVVLAEGSEQILSGYGDNKVKAALAINSYNLQRDLPLDKAADWKAIDQAYGGYVVEFGDATEYPDFAAFQRHLASAKLSTTWDAPNLTLQVKYVSGADTLEIGARTDFTYNDQSNKCFTYRRVNGKWPYLPAGIDRDTNLTQQGAAGRLEKNGAVLTCEPGVMAYLQTEPISGTFCGFNPLPDPTCWSLQVPGGVTIKADGRLGLARVAVRPRENTLWLEYGVKDDQHTDDMATSLLVFGLPSPPKVYREGKLDAAKVVTVMLDGKTAYVIPLFPNAPAIPVKTMATRYARAEQLFSLLTKRADLPVFVQDWLLAGPFFNDFLGKGFLTAYPPEKTPAKIDRAATFTSVVQQEGKDVKKTFGWTRIQSVLAPVIGAASVNLLPLLTPNRAVTAYLTTTITSDLSLIHI